LAFVTSVEYATTLCQLTNYFVLECILLGMY